MKALRIWLIAVAMLGSVVVLIAQQPVNVVNSPSVSITGTPSVTVSSGSITANQGGTWTVQPGNTPNTTAWKVDGSAVTQPVSGTVTANAGSGTFNIQANASVNLAQVAGSSTATSATGVQKVGLVGNAGASVDGATGAAPPANVVYVGGLQSGATGGLLGGMTVCELDKEINVTANTQLVTGVAGRKVRICAIELVVAAATNVAVVSGTGSVCATGITSLFGGTTAATGWNFAANGGIAFGSGVGEVAAAHNTGDNVCILVSAANQTSGNIKYTIY